MPKASQILTETAELLAQSQTWCQGDMHRVNDKRQVAHCALGGLEATCFKFEIKENRWGPSYSFASLTPRKGYKKAYNPALEYLGKQVLASKKLSQESKDEVRGNNLTWDDDDNEVFEPSLSYYEELIITFNDGYVGTQKNVVDLFRRAAKNAAKNGD